MWTPRQVLERALEEVDSQKMLMVVVVDRDGENFNVSWMQSGMNMPEIIALAKIVEAKAIRELGY